jgi:hypothetical protein
VPKGSRRVPWDPEIKNLLVIAGLSGCGKSTFIRQLKRKRLSPDIARRLPGDIHAWHYAWGRRRRTPFRSSVPTAKPRGQILHFDMTTSTAYRQSFGQPPEPHREEARLNMLLEAAEDVRFVVIRAPKEKLVRQLAGRTAVAHLPAHIRPLLSRAGPLLLRLERLLPAGVKSGAIHFGDRWAQRADAREKNFLKCQFYTQEAAIDSVHRDWEASVREQIGSKLTAPIMYIEPASNGFWQRRFRLGETTAQSPPAQAGADRRKTRAQISLGRLQQFANTLDSAFRIPGTKATVGVDVMLGIIPVLGDAVSGSIGAYIIWKAGRLGAPRKLLGRMMLNTTLDTIIGCVPIAGDIFDASYKSNVRNVALLRRYLSGLDLFRAPIGRISGYPTHLGRP